VIVSVVNGLPPMSIGMTIPAGGCLVSGQLIGGSDFLARLADVVETANEPVGQDGVKVVSTAFSQAFREQSMGFDITQIDQDQRDQVPRYIHVKDALVVVGGNTSTTPLWRGRLTSVDAWWFGEPNR